jgi:hypothetical protein
LLFDKQGAQKMKKKQIKTAIASGLVGLLSPLAMAVPVSAADVTWSGATDASWLLDSNWDTVAPVNGNSVIFPATSSHDFESATVRATSNDISSLSLVKIIFSGEVSLSSTSFTVDGNDLTITSGIDAIMTGSGGDHSVGVGVTLGADATFKTAGSNSLSVGGDGKILDLAANDLTLDAQGGTISILGKIKGSGNIIKSGTGKVKLLAIPDSAGYTGGLTAPTGEIVVDQNLGLNVTLTGGTLKGVGTVGDVNMSAGKVAPGASPGVLNTGDLTFTGGTHEVELGGKAAGEFDQLNVTGTVNLGSATTLAISLWGSFQPAVNDAFVIINNDGADAVSGTFSGLADGAKVTLGGYTYQINYDAGDGNDVVLLLTGTPSAPDTGVGSLINSPFASVIAAILVAAAIASFKVYEYKKK